MQQFKNIEEYLAFVGQQRNSSFGQRFRRQFQDSRGTAELAMLAAPSENEFDDFSRAVAAMTAVEKKHPDLLSDDQVRDIAQRAQAEIANVSIFINGYVLAQKNAKVQKKVK